MKSLDIENVIQPPSFNTLFTFVQRSEIEEKIAAVPKEKVEELHQAILKGNHRASIFEDVDCQLCLLSLMKGEKIPFWHGITVYFYLMTLAQFTSKQPLRSEDRHVKSLRSISVATCTKYQRITEDGHLFIKNTMDRMKRRGYLIDSTDFETFVSKLAPSEQWLICIPFADTIENPIDNQIRKLCDCIPLITFSSEELGKACWIPSLSIFQYLLERMSKPMRLYPVFGSVEPLTLKKFHLQSFHPFSLYSSLIQSIPTHTGDYLFGGALTGIGQAFLASLLTGEEREKILLKLSPELKKLLPDWLDMPLKSTIEKMVNNACKDACDFNLSPFMFFHPMYRFDSYIRKISARNIPIYQGEYTRDSPIGSPEDQLYYVVRKILLENPDDVLLRSFFNQIYSDKDFKRRTTTVHAVEILAGYRLNTFCENTRNVNIDWKAWQKLLETCPDSNTLWERARNEREPELVKLINDYELKFFHPLLPMTAEKKMQFGELIERQLAPSAIIQQGIFNHYDSGNPENRNPSLHSVKM